MQALIVAIVLGSVVPLVSCKPIAREPESEPEFLGGIPRYVKKFLRAAENSPSASTSKHIRSRFSAESILSIAGRKLDYKTYKEVLDGLERHAFYAEWDLERAIADAVGEIDADKKIAYLIEKGGNIDNALKNVHASYYPDLIRMGADPNKAMILAIEKGHTGMVRTLVEEFGANNLDDGLVLSVKKNDVDMARYMIDKGATNLNKASEAISVTALDAYASPQMLELLLERGANNINVNEVLDNVRNRIKLINNPAAWYSDEFGLYKYNVDKRQNHLKILEKMQQILQGAQGALTIP